MGITSSQPAELLYTEFTVGYRIQNYSDYSTLTAEEKEEARLGLLEHVEGVLTSLKAFKTLEHPDVESSGLDAAEGGWSSGPPVMKGDHVWIHGALVCDAVYPLLKDGVHYENDYTVGSTTVVAKYYLHAREHH